MPPRRGNTKLVADAMLGSLARKLRAIGFDTLYFRAGSDPELLALAEGDGRLILTADRSLAGTARRRGLPAILVTGRSDTVRLKGVVEGSRALGLPLVRGDSLCSVCNGPLAPLRKNEVAGRVPASVLRRHRLFYECGGCGKIYWRGGHWKKLRSFTEPLREE